MPIPCPPNASELAAARHGGRLALAHLAYPQAPRPFIDLSTGINPVPYPVPVLAPETLTRLPEPEALHALEQAARACYRVPPGADVIAVPGSEAAIGLLARLVAAPARVGVLAPTYGSHARAWLNAGHEVREVAGLGEMDGLGVAVIVRPNNPDGLVAPEPAIAAAANARAGGPGLVVLDEAFADACPELSLAPRTAELPGLVVLRSFGKFYGLAGLRLGFVVTAHPIGVALRQAIGDWPVSGAAIAIGTSALRDTVWGAATRARLKVDSGRLDSILAAGGLERRGGTALFAFAGHAPASGLQVRLARAGLLVRAFPNWPDRLRFGLPPDEPAWTRLEKALA